MALRSRCSTKICHSGDEKARARALQSIPRECVFGTPLSRFGCHVSGHTDDWPQRADSELRQKKEFSDFLCAICALDPVPSVLNLSGVSWEAELYRSHG